MDTNDTVDAIERIRTDNNALWMQLLKLALQTAPTSAKSILKQINENDRRVSSLLEKLAND